MNRYPTKEDIQRMYSSPIGMYSIYIPRGKQLYLSEWFDGNKFVPFHNGVYAVDGNLFKHWNGDFWGKRALTPIKANDFQHDKDSIQNGFWVGLKEKFA